MKTITKSPIKMHNPPHPGEILRELCLDPLGLTVTQAADALGVSRKTLSSILNGHSGISAEMAIRLSIAFNTTAESWLLQQLQYDLAQVEPKRKSFQVKNFAANIIWGIHRRRRPGTATGASRWL
jgi:antitoxin HigA-1